MCATSCTAWSNASWFAWDGFVVPLILRTYCSAAACTSSLVAGGTKLWRVRMLRHMPSPYVAPPTSCRSVASRSLREVPDAAEFVVSGVGADALGDLGVRRAAELGSTAQVQAERSEEHTSEL